MLGHKANLSNFKKTEIELNIFSDQNGMKLEISSGRNIEMVQIHVNWKTYYWTTSKSKKKLKGKF